MTTFTATRILIALGLATALVAGLAASAPAATRASGAGTTYVAPTVPPDEVVLGQLTSAGRSPRTTSPSTSITTSGPGTRAPAGIADDLKGGPGCSIQCITSGVAYARGPAARLVVTTDGTPVSMTLGVSGPGYFRQLESADGVTSFGFDVVDLEADTTYDAVVTAWDGQGYAASRFGSFTTLQRDVVLEIDHATLSATPYGGDEMTARLWFDGFLQYHEWGLDPDDDVLALGPIVVHDADRARYLDLAVELVQSEEDPDDVCESASNPDGPDVGHYQCTRWASAYPYGGDAVDLDDRPDGADSWTEWTIALDLVLPSPEGLPPGHGEPLNFRVPVTLEVTYT